MPAPTITPLPEAPLRSDAPATFNSKAEAFVDALEGLPAEINAWSSYLDGLGLSGTSWKQAVRVATTEALTLATDFEDGDTVDGVVLATGDRFLNKNAADPAENGIYTVNASGAPTRATDFDGASEILGAGVYVIAGTVNGGSIWLNTNTSAVTIGTTALTFAKFAGGNAWNLQFGPRDNDPPATNYATLDTRNNRPVLDFDDTTQEAAVFTGVLPDDYDGGGLTVTLWCSMTSAVSGTVGWDVAIERTQASTDDIDSDSFATAATITAATVPGTSGQVLKMSVNIANGADLDSLAAGELFRLRVRRDVANDTAVGDAELLRVMVTEQ